MPESHVAKSGNLLVCVEDRSGAAVEAFKKSVPTEPACCRKHRIRMSEFNYWRRKLSSSGIVKEAAQWVPVTIDKPIYVRTIGKPAIVHTINEQIGVRPALSFSC